MSKPTKQQLEWADLELGVIIHYLIEAADPKVNIKSSEVREKLPPSVFAPEGWDTDQWIRSVAELGGKYAVFVANHCTGFSLWQTKDNDYSVASCAYKDGKGDVVRDFIESCKKYNIKPGLYYSTGCNGYYGISDNEIRGLGNSYYQTEHYRDYVKHVEAQVTELWSEYGDLFEIWFDGGIVPLELGGPNLVPILEKYQPNAICFQGPKEHKHNLRWVGNERGLAPIDCWSMTNSGEDQYGGDEEDIRSGVGLPNGKYFRPAETDMPNREMRWGWQPNETKYAFSKEHLLDCYLRSVGRNTNLLLGMAIGIDGKFEDENQFIDFGRLLADTFGEKARIGYKSGTCEKVQTVVLDEPAEVKYVMLRENMEEGHGVLGFRVLLDGREVFAAKCIGHKRIVPIENSGKVTKVTLEITDSADTLSIRDIAVY